MPGKHVRFADSIPETPSPTWTISSLPSSTGPITPLPVGYALPPMQGLFAVCRINPILAASMTPRVIYDVSLLPSTVVPRDPKVPDYVLSEPATEPPVPYMELVSSRIPWKIIIHPSNREVSIVTVGDVIAGIYRNLRLPVSPAEFSLVQSKDQQTRISDAYRRRCKRLPTAEAIAKDLKKGLKRVDFLEGSNIFSGLSATKEGGHVWQLHAS
ncbi:hypothetical protein EST38_g4387 [Candolleomyces aberdarensis]|uniref:DUF6699 domain-containing protein n=1 Tax=Candolleomyces aberdarensis TaxID=2316362 RepID=A0A4Q2DN39_9AGAR|nr:hypothetical protein EST38_g4387 [Candolleomyces aberdarensis]